MTGNIVSVSWYDHLMFGEGDGRLLTPEALRRRMAVWRDELGAEAMHWRSARVDIEGSFHIGDGGEHPLWFIAHGIDWDELEVAPALAHQAGLEAYLYPSLFDEGWPLAPPEVRAGSYHNAMHAQHVSWQSAFSQAHPEFHIVDRNGRRQWGVMCLAYPEVRHHFRQRFLRLLAGGPFDGLFVCLRSQAKPPDTGDQFGFNAIIADDYGKATGDDLDQADFDIVAWRHLLGGYLTKFITELGDELRQHDLKLGIGAARGDIIGPPLGNWNLDWRQWLEQDLVDHLAIDQNSSRCPSLWHDLWPMHRGSGYRQNYLTGKGMPALVQHLDRDYAPALRKSRSSLYLARQWQHRDSTEESELTAHEAVSGLIFSSFRHDNPGPLARADFVA